MIVETFELLYSGGTATFPSKGATESEYFWRV